MMFSAHSDAFIECAHACRGRLLSTARRLLPDRPAAQDAVQDAMVLAMRSLPRFRGDSQMSTWLGRIVINVALTRRRVVRRRPEQSLETLLEHGESGDRSSSRLAPLTAAAPGPEREAMHGELRTLLRAAIDELRRDYRTVVLMRHYEDASIATIAEQLQITPNAAKLRLIRAHRALRVLLARRGYEQPASGAGARPARRGRPAAIQCAIAV
jgi:RNA polymerase sigma-70 factor (ECF subfamily)